MFEKMIATLYLVVAALSVALCFTVFKSVGRSGFFIIFSYFILMIPDRFLMGALSDLYVNLDLGILTNIAIWLEGGMAFMIITSLLLSFVGFLLIARKKKDALNKSTEEL